jgi:hypothetical protein
MGTNQTETNQAATVEMSQEEVLKEILYNTRKTKNYLKWQLYITLTLVVVPLLAMIFIVPMVLRSVADMYGSVLQ